MVSDLIVLHTAAEFESQDTAYKVCLPGTLANPVHRGIDIGVDATVERSLGSGYGIGHCHAQVIVAVEFNRDLHRLRQFLYTIIDSHWGIVT